MSDKEQAKQKLKKLESENKKLLPIAHAAQSLLSEDGAKEALAHYVVLQILADRVRDWEGK